MTRRKDFLDMDDTQDRLEPGTVALFLLVGLLSAMLVASALTGYDTLKENIDLKAKLELCSQK